MSQEQIFIPMLVSVLIAYSGMFVTPVLMVLLLRSVTGWFGVQDRLMRSSFYCVLVATGAALFAGSLWHTSMIVIELIWPPELLEGNSFYVMDVLGLYGREFIYLCVIPCSLALSVRYFYRLTMLRSVAIAALTYVILVIVVPTFYLVALFALTRPLAHPGLFP